MEKLEEVKASDFTHKVKEGAKQAGSAIKRGAKKATEQIKSLTKQRDDTVIEVDQSVIVFCFCSKQCQLKKSSLNQSPFDALTFTGLKPIYTSSFASLKNLVFSR